MMLKRHRFLILLTGVFCLSLQAAQERSGSRQEESEDYFEKWLKQDAVYIITDDEKTVFQKLTTPEEKEQFIEQFWFRRDPDPKTAVNEFKEEHYRRLAYANERFSVGMPGWMSDRGRVYIIHGPPDQIESHPTGGQYQRPGWEGGGWTQTYPFEVWRYRYIEGMGSEVMVEFVDKTLSGQYQLAVNPEEKDALLQMGSAGATLSEILHQSRKANRPYFDPAHQGSRYVPNGESAFDRYAKFAKIQAPPAIKYKDLQELVKTNVTYQNLSFQARSDYFRLNQAQTVVPVTLEIRDDVLTFREQDGVFTAEIAVYGIITSITNRVIQEFEDDLVTSYRPNDPLGGKGRSLYQRTFVLDNAIRYKIDLVVKDVNSGKVGVLRKALAPPRVPTGEPLGTSSLILSDYVQLLADVPRDDLMFVLGDVKIRPSLNDSFAADRPLAVYLQVYNVRIDQANQAPSLQVNYTIERDGKRAVELEDLTGQGVYDYSGDRLVLLQELPIDGLGPGKYHLDIQIKDTISNQTISTSADFLLTEGKGPAD